MELRRPLRVLVAIRLAVAATILLSAIFIQAAASLQLPLVYLAAVFGGAVLLSAAYPLLATRISPAAQAYLQLAGDALLVTLLIYASGGADSVFTFLYLVVIGAAALLLRRRGGLVLASLSSIFYGLLMEGMAYGLLPSPPFSAHPPWRTTAPGYPLAVNVVAFYCVAILAAIMGEKLRSAREELAARRSEIERMRALHADVIESMSSGLATLDPVGRVTFLNQTGALILGVSKELAAGRFLWDVGLLERAEWVRIREGLAHGSNPRGEVENFIAGQAHTLGFTGRRLKGTSGFLLLFQDLTEYKKMENDARSHEKLAAVGQLAAGIAHEIRNPLASISGSAQMLERGMETGSQERRLLEIIVVESHRLSKILEEFLRYARPAAPRPTSFDIAALLAESMDLFRHSDEVADKHRLELSVEPGHSEILGDPDHIRQIFWNVARNAIHAMPAGGTLRVEGSEDGSWYSIRFCDTGRGMTAQEQENLFQPFASSFDDGLGLGLAIVRRLTEDQGGVIQVDSEQGRGTRIEIRLPRAGRQRAETPAA